MFAPLTGIEVLDTRVDGAVLVIEARLSVNLNALTIEQARVQIVERAACGSHRVGAWLGR